MREQEIQIRIQMVRRVAFVIFSAPIDHYQPQLPNIQEKVVELLKSHSESIQAEVCF